MKTSSLIFSITMNIIFLVAMWFSTTMDVGWAKNTIVVLFNVTNLYIIALCITAIFGIFKCPDKVVKAHINKLDNDISFNTLYRIWSVIYRIAAVAFCIYNGFIATAVLFVFCIAISEIFVVVLKQIIKDSKGN